MNKFLMTSAALVALTVSASAADLRTKAPAYVAQPISSWTGFYVGVNGGYAGGESSLGVDAAALGGIAGPTGLGALDLKSNGFFGGAQIGYNWQVGQVVWGFEADIQGSNIESKLNLGAFGGGGPVGFAPAIGTKVDYFGTVRGRVGVTPWDRTLAYVTGGLAYGQTSTDYLVQLGSKNKIGWTVGAGVEYQIAQNWTFKTEYLYVDLGRDNLDLGALGAIGGGIGFPPGFALYEDTRIHAVRGGVNYHF